MLLSEKVRVEVFIPDLPDPSYSSLLRQLESELSYAFGGCTVLSAAGHFRSNAGFIIPDNIHLLFTDLNLELQRDSLVIGQYVERIQSAIHEALTREQSVLVVAYPVYHVR